MVHLPIRRFTGRSIVLTRVVLCLMTELGGHSLTQAQPAPEERTADIAPAEQPDSRDSEDEYFALMKKLNIGDRRDLPQLFVSGDSISQHYTPALKDSLRGKLNITHWMDLPARYPEDVPKIPHSGTSDLLIEMLRSVLDSKKYQPRFVLLNAGLHDATYQYSPAAHREKLIKIVELVAQHKVKMIWVATTPREPGDPHNRLIDAYNIEARKVMGQHLVPVIGLDRFTADLIAQKGAGAVFQEDGLHFSTKTRTAMGRFIAAELLDILKDDIAPTKDLGTNGPRDIAQPIWENE